MLNETSDDLCYAIGRNQGEDFSKWQMEKKISLGSGYRYCIGAAKGRYLLLEREVAMLYVSFSLPLLNPADKEYFLLNVETLHLERAWGKQPIWPGTSRTYLYTSFPPSSLLSSPTIWAGKLSSTSELSAYRTNFLLLDNSLSQLVILVYMIW